MLCVTLKTHKKDTIIPGQILNIPGIKYGDTLESVINNLNQFRAPTNQITTIYNPLGQIIPKQYWTFKIKENMVFFLDQP